MQDLAVVPILFLVGVLGASGSGSVGRDLAVALGEAALAIGLLYALGRLAVRPALRLVAQSRSPEMFMAAVLLIVIGTAALTGAAGLSMALGAFLAGLVLAETEYAHEVEVSIEPFKGLMLGLFFMSVGMGIDWRVIGQEPGWIIASAIGLLALKTVLNTGLCLAFGLPRHVAAETGLLLAQGGEFAFIVIGLAVANALIPGPVGQFMLIVAGVTMVLTPLLAGLARRIGARLERQADTAAADGQAFPEIEGHVLLAGFGRVGRTLADILDAEGIGWLALDTDADTVAVARKERRPVWFGDAGRLDMLARARIGAAAAVVVTMDDPRAAERVAGEIRRAHPELPIYARARDLPHAGRLRAAGADVAVPETIEGSLQLAGRVLAGMGTEDEVIRRRLDAQRGLDGL
jgi:CPA2 family monovalent cation:H+ antiporter-2